MATTTHNSGNNWRVVKASDIERVHFKDDGGSIMLDVSAAEFVKIRTDLNNLILISNMPAAKAKVFATQPEGEAYIDYALTSHPRQWKKNGETIMVKSSIYVSLALFLVKCRCSFSDIFIVSDQGPGDAFRDPDLLPQQGGQPCADEQRHPFRHVPAQPLHLRGPARGEHSAQGGDGSPLQR